MNVKEKALLLTISLEQHYSLFHNNDFHSNDVDDINNTWANNACVELYNITRGTHFNSPVDNGGISHSDIRINIKEEPQYNILINNRDNQLIPLGGG